MDGRRFFILSQFGKPVLDVLAKKLREERKNRVFPKKIKLYHYAR